MAPWEVSVRWGPVNFVYCWIVVHLPRTSSSLLSHTRCEATMKMSILARAVGGCVALHSAQGFVVAGSALGRVSFSCFYYGSKSVGVVFVFVLGQKYFVYV